MAAVEASVFSVTTPPLDEGHAVARNAAHERMVNVGESLLDEEETVATAARVSGEPVAGGDLVDCMAEGTASVPQPLPERESLQMRVAVHSQEKRMSAA